MFLILFISRPIMLSFTLSLWAVQPLVLGYSNNVKYGFFLMEWALSQITHVLATSSGGTKYLLSPLDLFSSNTSPTEK